ncbi:MAG TPA: hypothetical protein PKD24_08505 [Pyrinomonadaceae bacterium]|nr:hypothetical protein [Pyrinomonadaceae bacterium]HMP65891.1 hypothetical protein [Pyrinomonadaceae bacterium]
MRYLSHLIIALVLTSAAFAQDRPAEGPKFDIADFSKKVETAEWLVEYDGVAWRSTDMLPTDDKSRMARLGPEWFCFQDEQRVWHAVYGRLTEGKYDLVFHFVAGKDGVLARTDADIDQDFLNKHAAALSTGREQLLRSIPPGSPRFNQYIRKNSDNTYSVWFFPAFQPNRIAVYGGEGVYLIDAAGTKIIKDESYFQKDFRGFASEPPREIWLDYREIKKPTLGGVFFALYYRNYFTKIVIDTGESSNMLVRTNDSFVWVNVEKDEKGEKPQ